MIGQNVVIAQFLFAAFVALGAVYIGSELSHTPKKRSLKMPMPVPPDVVPEEDTLLQISEEAMYPTIMPFELPGAIIESIAPEIPLPTAPVFEKPIELPPTIITPNNMSSNMIETDNLRKIFSSKGRGAKGTVEAVKSITFSVPRGEIFGLLGPNGAGKTTTMRMLSTLLIPTSGTARIGGHNLVTSQQEIRRMIGYVSQVGGMQRESTGRENLLLQAKLYGMTDLEATARVIELIKMLNLETFADRKTGTYSGGQRRIFDLASGIVHQPELLFLDEPSTGLDPQNRVHIWEQVKKMNEAGTTIFVTTHYLEEADELCDRVAIVDQGTIVAIGTPEELKRQIAGDIITLEFAQPQLVDAAVQTLEGRSFIVDQQVVGTTLNLYVENGNENLSLIITLLHEKDIETQSVSLARPRLDDVFLKLTGRSMREAMPEK